MNQSYINDFRTASETVSQMFSAVNKAEMTVIESNLWSREIERLGPAALLSFAEFWMSGGGQGNYRRTPTIDDFMMRADPSYVNAATALDRLIEEVRRSGPYNNPTIEDLKLREAIARMGGWAKVCQDMPDPSSDFAFKRFSERFRAAWTHSEALQVQHKLNPPALLGLVASPGQIKLAWVAPESEVEVLLPGPRA